MKRFIIERSADEFYTSHSGLALIGLGINRFTSLNAKLKKALPDTKDIANTDVIRSYLGLLSLGKSDFEAVSDMKEDKYFQQSLGIKAVPSPETLRQRLDETATVFQPLVSSTYTEFISNAKGKVTPLAMGHVAVDMDVFCKDNSGTKKEGCNHTYHGYDGYAPVAAYMGEEGWCINLEFREGSQHSQNNFIPFLQETISRARSLTKKPLLFRLDSAHDAVETRATLYNPKKVDYILKWNPRKQDLPAWLARGLQEGQVSEPRRGKRVAVFSF
ncbi:MAG: IS1380 family transposase, partial [Proteobacteria bacterium]|nr:IS1380 family transposase [Pseudomonadota bacterium]